MPSGILCVLLLYIFFKAKQSRKLVGLVFLLFYSFTNPILINSLLLYWEYPAQKMENMPRVEWGIILTGGIMNDEKEPATNIYFGKSADRMAQALMLYKKQKIKKILISGGSNNIFSQSVSDEGKQIAKYLIMSGVRQEDIFLERQSRNTFQNATHCAKFLHKYFPHQKYILISSATHLPRAIACFKKQNLEVIPFGAGYFSHEPKLLVNYFLPHEEYLYYSQGVFHEIVGWVIYKIVGYC